MAIVTSTHIDFVPSFSLQRQSQFNYALHNAHYALPKQTALTMETFVLLSAQYFSVWFSAALHLTLEFLESERSK